jgi:hypothetical protein
MSVASLVDQRSVEDCPRSIERGSAVKLAIDGLAGGGGGAAGGGAGGGAGAGAFFLQPAEKIKRMLASKTNPILAASIARLLIPETSLLVLSPK